MRFVRSELINTPWKIISIGTPNGPIGRDAKCILYNIVWYVKRPTHDFTISAASIPKVQCVLFSKFKNIAINRDSVQLYIFVLWNSGSDARTDEVVVCI